MIEYNFKVDFSLRNPLLLGLFSSKVLCKYIPIVPESVVIAA